MFNGRQINDEITKLHERALSIVYNDTITSFEELLIKDKTFTIDHQNTKSIEMYKTVSKETLAKGGNFSEIS